MELTNLFAAKIRAHDILGRHLLKQEKDKEGDQGLDEARRLSTLQKDEGCVSFFDTVGEVFKLQEQQSEKSWWSSVECLSAKPVNVPHSSPLP